MAATIQEQVVQAFEIVKEEEIAAPIVSADQAPPERALPWCAG